MIETARPNVRIDRSTRAFVDAREPAMQFTDTAELEAHDRQLR